MLTHHVRVSLDTTVLTKLPPQTAFLVQPEHTQSHLICMNLNNVLSVLKAATVLVSVLRASPSDKWTNAAVLKYTENHTMVDNLSVKQCLCLQGEKILHQTLVLGATIVPMEPDLAQNIPVQMEHTMTWLDRKLWKTAKIAHRVGFSWNKMITSWIKSDWFQALKSLIF